MQASKHCSSCNAAISHGATFCPTCGAQQPATPPTPNAGRRKQGGRVKMILGVIVALLFVCIVIAALNGGSKTGDAGSTATSANARAELPASTTSSNAPTATPKATATVAPTATPKPTATVAPTATPKPAAITVAFTGQFQPTILRVGEKLVVQLGLENKSSQELKGFRVFSTGPWDKYTIVNVMPAGSFDNGLFGTTFTAGMLVPAGEKRFLNIVAYPNEPGSHKFTFEARMPESGALANESGEQPVIGGTVSVTR